MSYSQTSSTLDGIARPRRQRRVCVRPGRGDAGHPGAVRLARRLDGIRRQLEPPRARHLHGRRRPLSAAASCDVRAPRRRAPSRASRTSRTIRALDYNPLHGGIARWFEPIDAGSRRRARADDDSARSAARCSARSRRTRAAWHVEVHQFRIEARAGEAGPADPGRAAPRRRRLRAGAARRPAEHRQRHDDDSCGWTARCSDISR